MHWTEAEELAAHVLGLDPDTAGSEEIDVGLVEKFDVGLEGFQKIAEALVPFTIPAVTALGGQVCQGFVKDGAFICKQEVKK